MSLSLATSLPVARQTVVSVTLPDGAVLFSPETEVYYGMNNVGAVIWELLAQPPLSLDALCAAVHERFPDAALGQIHEDVVELLGELERAGLVDCGENESAT